MGLFDSVGGLVGGIIGNSEASGDRGLSEDQMKAALAAISNVKTPDDLAKAITLNSYNQAGTLTPEMLQKLNLLQDNQLSVSDKPEDIQNQQYALNALKQLSETGMSAQDLAQFNQMRSQVAADTNAKTQSLLQQAQMRGQAGAGDTLASQLLASQAGSQSAAKGASDLAANATASRQNALNSYSNLSGQVRGQNFNTAQVNNQNELLRRQFLDQNATARQAANVGAANNANLYNTQRQQGVSDANTGAQNNELYSQKQRQQQLFQDQMQKAGALAGQYNGQSKYYNDRANATAQNWTNIGQGVGGMVGGLNFGGGGGGSGGGTAMAGEPGGSSGGMQGMEQLASTALMFAAHGGTVPGKAPVEGDSSLNDIIPAMLSPGEKVLPRSVANDPEKAADFVRGENKKPNKGSALFKSLSELFKHAHEMSKDE